MADRSDHGDGTAGRVATRTIGNRDGGSGGTDGPAVTRREAIAGGVTAALGLSAPGVGPEATAGAQSDAVLFRRDFEDLPEGDWTVEESEWGGLNPWSADAAYVDVTEIDGTKALDARFPANQAGNGNGGGSLMVPFGRHYEELYHGYRVKFGEGFEFDNAGGKLPGLIGSADGVYAVTGGDDPNGENGWSARMMWRDPVEESPDRGGLVMFYVYHPDQPGEYGENMHWDDGPSGQVYFERGEWHEIEHRIVMNTTGENDGVLASDASEGSSEPRSDGVLEGWFDGEKAFERRDLRFRDVPELGINRFYLSTFFGGGNTPKWAHSREEHIYYDDFVTSTEPIWNGSDDGQDTVDPIDGETPTDPDDDGDYEDFNGNGEVDFDDVVTYFEHMDDPVLTDHVDAYDYNGNSEIDFADVVDLFGAVE